MEGGIVATVDMFSGAMQFLGGNQSFTHTMGQQIGQNEYWGLFIMPQISFFTDGINLEVVRVFVELMPTGMRIRYEVRNNASSGVFYTRHAIRVRP
jgi:hypothetical protein